VATRTRPTVARRMHPCVGGAATFVSMVGEEREGAAANDKLGEKGSGITTFMEKRKDKDPAFPGIFGFGGVNHQKIVHAQQNLRHH